MVDAGVAVTSQDDPWKLCEHVICAGNKCPDKDCTSICNTSSAAGKQITVRKNNTRSVAAKYAVVTSMRNTYRHIFVRSTAVQKVKALDVVQTVVTHVEPSSMSK